MTSNSVYDGNGKAYTFDVWRLWAGWDGGTIHDALEDFSNRPMAEKDSFCNFLMNHLDHDQLKDLESGWASRFFRARLGLARAM